jgi:endonuclease G, mitochondrial
MNLDQVTRNRTELCRELQSYLDARKPRIASLTRTVEAEGSIGAAGPEAVAQNALQRTVSEGRFLEATIRADDKAPINFLERGQRAARAVCRIVDRNRVALGTGFLVGPGLLLTNNHVLPSVADAEGCVAEFDYEENADEIALPVRRFPIDPATTFISSPRDALDFALVGLAPLGREGTPLAERGWLPLDGRRNKIFEGQPIVIVQHPQGRMKEICLFDSVLTYRDEDGPFLLYSTDTADGTSGSPCFNRFWQVVALHHASVDTDQRGPAGRSRSTAASGSARSWPRWRTAQG